MKIWPVVSTTSMSHARMTAAIYRIFTPAEKN